MAIISIGATARRSRPRDSPQARQTTQPPRRNVGDGVDAAASTGRATPPCPRRADCLRSARKGRHRRWPEARCQAMQQSRAITRKSASNLALAFVLLPRAKRYGMSVLYAFCREIDDVADNESLPTEQRRAQLAAWRADLGRACGSETPHFAVNRELQPVIRRYRLPLAHFEELL